MVAIRFYEAYRLKKEVDLWAYLKEIHASATIKVRGNLYALYLRTIQDVACHEEIRHVLSLPKDTELLPMEIADYFEVMYRQQLDVEKRNQWCFDVSVSVREVEGRHILIPYSDMLMSGIFSFLKKDSRLESFSYWDNGDIPQKISDEEWADRARIWKIIVDSWNCYLNLEVVSCRNFRNTDINPLNEMMMESPWQERFTARDTRRIKLTLEEQRQLMEDFSAVKKK